MKMHALFAAAALAIAGCASGYYGPHYERATSQYDDGYSEFRLDENRYRVQYRLENGDPQLAEDWAMRRAAELTIQHGYDWFQVLSRSSAYSDDDFRRYDNYQHYDDRYDERPRYDSRYNDDSLAVIEVLMGNDPPPRSASVYDARRVLDYTRGGSRDYDYRRY